MRIGILILCSVQTNMLAVIIHTYTDMYTQSTGVKNPQVLTKLQTKNTIAHPQIDIAI